MEGYMGISFYPDSFLGGRLRPRRLFWIPFSSLIHTWGDIPKVDQAVVPAAPLRHYNPLVNACWCASEIVCGRNRVLDFNTIDHLEKLGRIIIHWSLSLSAFELRDIQLKGRFPRRIIDFIIRVGVVNIVIATARSLLAEWCERIAVIFGVVVMRNFIVVAATG
ncbi:hypothetical protein Bca4012_064908 [Brassica carinata]